MGNARTWAADVAAVGLFIVTLALLVANVANHGGLVSWVAVAAGATATVTGLLAAARQVRFERAETVGGPTTPRVVVDLVRRSWFVWAALVVYEAALLLGRGPSSTAVAAVAVAVGLVPTAVVMWRSRGVERQVFFESTSIAFFVVLLAVVAVGAAGPRGAAASVAPWLVYVVGLVSWGIAAGVRSRQLGA